MTTMLEHPKKMVLGNEGVAMALNDGGISYVSAYAGTPSTEILEWLLENSDENLHAAWATNETVALEEAIAAAITGKDAAMICKSVGLNVAMDPLMTVCNMGVNAGLVIIVADDPGMHSSQNEQDNRYVAHMSNLPMLEPTNIQQAYDYTREAVQLSRQFKIPVIVRLVTRISHALGPLKQKEKVQLEPLPYEKNPSQFVSVPGNARGNHEQALKIMEGVTQYVDSQSYYEELPSDDSELLVITPGNASNYAVEAINDLEIAAHIFIPHIVHPLPEAKIVSLLEQYDDVLIIEELEPVLETQIRNISNRYQIDQTIIGKGVLTQRSGELNIGIVKSNLADFLGIDTGYVPLQMDENLTQMRPPVLCAGCPHRSSYVLMKQVMKQKEPIFCSDIGCYALGVLPPHQSADFLVDMGASIPMATATSVTQPNKTSIAVIGDSTFWHSGLSGLVNAIWKDANIIVYILDNSTTAMTGSQDNPSAPNTSTPNKLDIGKVAESMGAKVWDINPMNYKESIATLREVTEHKGVRVIVSEYPCAILEEKESKDREHKYATINENCNGCTLCVKQLGCPALSMEGYVANIDPNLCNNCGFCAQICRRDAIDVM